VFVRVRCGGRRRVLAYVNKAGGVRAILEHLGPAHGRCEAGPGARAPPRLVVLTLKPPAPTAPGPCRAPHGRAAWAGVYPKGRRGFSTRLAHCSGGPPSAALLGSSAPALTLHMVSIPPIHTPRPQMRPHVGRKEFPVKPESTADALRSSHRSLIAETSRPAWATEVRAEPMRIRSPPGGPTLESRPPETGAPAPP
jgi:hypothetical protein